ncbi:hypothetical protein F5Y17DRAFT_227155 [Xylariaceae sp. FL0594]|nr:hypothetical protein F5Y17DRAFT_227155 [Xylariaceae sp. FL0594]
MADPSRECVLTSLPTELLQLISTFLPASSVVCLTLTCKAALSILGTSSWCSPTLRRCPYSLSEERRELVKLLSREPELNGVPFQYCPRCQVLHPSTPTPPAQYRRPRYRPGCGGYGTPMGHLPTSDSGGGYLLVLQHILHVLETVPDDSDAAIAYLAGEYQVDFPNDGITYTISTSARRVHGNLVLQHRHVFRTVRAGARLKPSRLMDLPVRICPHQSTCTEGLPENEYIKTAKPNGPLFLYSICAALRSTKGKGQGQGSIEIPDAQLFRQPTRDEKRMMDLAGDDDTIFDCTRCPTKWRIEYDAEVDRSEMAITVWHCFFDEIRMASSVWSGFVWRADPKWRDDLNNEYWSKTRGFPDFEID